LSVVNKTPSRSSIIRLDANMIRFYPLSQKQTWLTPPPSVVSLRLLSDQQMLLNFDQLVIQWVCMSNTNLDQWRSTSYPSNASCLGYLSISQISDSGSSTKSRDMCIDLFASTSYRCMFDWITGWFEKTL